MTDFSASRKAGQPPASTISRTVLPVFAKTIRSESNKGRFSSFASSLPTDVLPLPR